MLNYTFRRIYNFNAIQLKPKIEKLLLHFPVSFNRLFRTILSNIIIINGSPLSFECDSREIGVMSLLIISKKKKKHSIRNKKGGNNRFSWNQLKNLILTLISLTLHIWLLVCQSGLLPLDQPEWETLCRPYCK